MCEQSLLAVVQLKISPALPYCARIQGRGKNMPLYEYWCNQCRSKVTIYNRGFSSSQVAQCPDCGNTSLRRLFSTFSVRKTDRDIYDSILSDSQLVKGMTQNNPRALMEWNKRMSRGEETAPEYEEMMKTMEGGAWPAELMGGGQQAPGETE